jgi:hypothetical protein
MLAVSEASPRSWLTGQSSVLKEMGLEVNTEKNECVAQGGRQNSNLNVDNISFEIVAKLLYLEHQQIKVAKGV